MTLYAHTLRPHHVQRLGDIFRLIRSSKSLYRWVRFHLDEFVSKHDRNDDFYPRRVSRIFAGELPGDLSLCALLYDFATIELAGYLKENHGKAGEFGKLISTIDALSISVTNQINDTNNPFSILARDIDATELNVDVPNLFINEFIGYRRSSRRGDVVRFYFKIYRQNRKRQPFVRYKNRYSRGNRYWTVKGGGVYTQEDTLYLFGHARDKNDRRSRGYRVQALKQLGTTNMLCGPVISMDSKGPIAARIILIPVNEHKKTEKQRKILDRDFIEYMVGQNSVENTYEYIEEVRKNISHCFGREEEQGLYYYMSNLTTTVLHGEPDEDDVLIKEEVEMRRIAYENGFDIADRLAFLMRRENSTTK